MQRRQATLKEKLSEHYQRRDFKPKKTQASNMGMLFFGGMLISLTIEMLVLLLPSYYFDEELGKYSKGYRILQVIAVLLCIESGANWWHSYYDVTNRVTKGLKAYHYPNMIETPPGWKNCPTCSIDAPPRSHHCALCNYCILKRDHHCFFTGSCIGHHNQRAFVIFCLYATVSSCVAIYFQLAFLNKEYPMFSSAAVFYFPLCAVWQFLTGLTSLLNMFILVHAYVTAFSLGMAVFFLGWQLIIIYRGQTSYEAWKQITLYQKQSTFDNFCSVFGSPVHLLVCLFLPILLPLPHEGVKWDIDPKTEKGH